MSLNKLNSWKRHALAAALLCATTVPALAAITGYTTRSGFDAATAGLTTQTTDFESVAAGTSFATGTGPAGSGFTLSAVTGAGTPTVADLFWTTSGTHYLGLDNSDTQFFSGDEVTFSFAQPVRAFGLYVIGGSDLQAGDIQLSAGGTDVLSSGSAEQTDGFGSYAYFLGLATDGASPSFASATLKGLAPGGTDFFLFAVDDVTLANPVPEPSTVALLSLGLLGLAASSRRRGR